MATTDEMNDPVILREALGALESCKTADDVRDVWARFYLKIGHKRLARLLLRRDPITGSKIKEANAK